MPVIQLDPEFKVESKSPTWNNKFKKKVTEKKPTVPKFAILEKGWIPSEVIFDQKSEPAKHALYNTSQNYFITGKAGTGKSTLLKEFVEYCKENDINCAVVAPTGIASINVGGSTIHSMFQIDIHNPTQLKKLNPIKKNLLRAIDVLIIDEISMVSDEIMEVINKRMNQAKFGDNPHSKKFGGARLLIFGDIFQLGPVNKDDSNPIGYFFESEVFEDMYHKGNIEILELDKIWRQDDPIFINLLNKIRNDTAIDEDLNILNNKILTEAPDVFAKENNFSILCTTNSQVNYYNSRILATIDSKPHKFNGQLAGEFTHYDGLPATELHLKKGCLVVLVKNDVNKRYVNGDFGIIQNFMYRITATTGKVEKTKNYTGSEIATERIKEDLQKFKMDGYNIASAGYLLEILLTRTGQVVQVPKESWERKVYEITEELVDEDGEKMIKQTLKDKTVGAYTQFPVKVGYALTIHKSQGMTLEGAILDFGSGTFGSGLAYVAFSRVKSLKNLYLTKQINVNIVKLDPKINEFFGRKNIVESLI
jgi:ATP-dependent exoDNAse (exonuclease V) alpha subunit